MTEPRRVLRRRDAGDGEALLANDEMGATI